MKDEGRSEDVCEAGFSRDIPVTLTCLYGHKAESNELQAQSLVYKKDVSVVSVHVRM